MLLWVALLACRGPAVETDSGEAPPSPAQALAGPDRVVEVGVPLTFDGSGSEGVSWEWTFGDGGRSDELVTTHTYSEPGNYSAVLRVVGEDGGWRVDAVQVTAHRPLAEVAPVASSSLAIDGEGRLYAVTPEADLLAVVEDGVARYVPTCEQPRTVAVDGDRVAVACERDALDLFDRQTLDRLDRIALPANSRAYGVVGRDDRWWVTLSATGQVAEIGDELLLHDVGVDPRAIALGPDDRVYVSRFRSPGSGGEIYVLGEGILSLAPVRGSDSDTATRGVPNLLGSLAIPPDGHAVWASGVLSNIYRGLNRDENALTFETTVRGMLTGVALETGLEDEAITKQFDNHGSADAMVFTAYGSSVWVAHPTTATVHRLDAYDGDVMSSLLDAGAGISGLQLSADGAVLYVHAWLDRELRAYDVSDASAQPGLLWSAPLVEDEPLGETVLRGKRIFHDATDRRMARDGYVTCVSCHPDGTQDGRTWDFTDRGEGLRNTITLEGRAGLAMGPLHWTGNFDEVQDFENDIRHGFGGAGFLDEHDWEQCEATLGPEKAGLDEDLDALAAYVASFVELPASPHAPDPDGEALFATLGCGDCHAGPLFTDSDAAFTRHDVGTIASTSGGRLGEALDGFDTPTLLGVWATPPYLHDGRASTVEQAIDAHLGVDLSDEELSRLAAYIRSL